MACYKHFCTKTITTLPGKAALAERKQTMLPPYTFMTLFRAEANDTRLVEEFLRQVRHTLESHPLFDQYCMVLGPTPAPLANEQVNLAGS